MSISNYAETKIVDAVMNATAFSVAARYVKLHLGDPGEDGTANAAVEATRKQVTSAAAVAGTFTSTNALTWTAVSTTETYSHISIWDAATVGNCLWTGALAAAKAMTAGDTFEIAVGGLTVSVD